MHLDSLDRLLPPAVNGSLTNCFEFIARALLPAVDQYGSDWRSTRTSAAATLLGS